MNPAFLFLFLIAVGLRPVEKDPAAAFESLEMSPRLDRTDTLRSILEVEGPSDAVLNEIGHLLAGSPLMKHRAESIEWSDRLQSPEALEALVTKSYRYRRCFNFDDARQTLARARELYPDHARPHFEMGMLRLEYGLDLWKPEAIREALDAFRKAAACEDATLDAWLGWCSALVALQRSHELEEPVQALLQRAPEDPATRLLHGLLLRAQGRSVFAEHEFRAGIARLPGSVQRRFLDVEDFVASVVPLPLDTSMVQPHLPREVLAWWARLVEGEILFSEPGDRPGWASHAGQVFLLYGWPDRVRYFPPFSGPESGEMAALSSAASVSGELAQLLGNRPGLNEQGYWLWIYDWDGYIFPYLFRRTARYADWVSTRGSKEKRLDPLRNAFPMRLTPPVPPRLDAQLHARHAVFKGSSNRIRLETYVGVHQDRPETGWALGLTVFSSDGDVIDERTLALTEDRRRSKFLAVTRSERHANALLAQMGSVVQPGSYVVRIDLLDPLGGLVRSEERGFEVTAPEDGLWMTEMVLADTFQEWKPDSSVPADLVRYAREIVPHPEYQVPADQETAYLYYEVVGAGVDSAGQAELDVVYEIFDQQTFDPLNVGLESPPSGRAPIERVEFPRDTVSVSRDGIVVKGTAVTLGNLEAGRYVLAVTVRDPSRVGVVQRYLAFARE